MRRRLPTWRFAVLVPSANNRAFEGSVGVFVDGVYLSRAGQLLSNFLDFDSLQVLRGPQGTLFGKKHDRRCAVDHEREPPV